MLLRRGQLQLPQAEHREQPRPDRGPYLQLPQQLQHKPRLLQSSLQSPGDLMTLHVTSRPHVGADGGPQQLLHLQGLLQPQQRGAEPGLPPLHLLAQAVQVHRHG